MDREWIEELLSKVNIVQLISRYVQLKRRGRTYWGCCPFHHEKEPSFAVNEDRQFYHCFGCKESGNAISFVEKIESVDFIDAVKILAADAKMELPKFGPDDDKRISADKRARMYELMRTAARHYRENLYGPGGESAMEYLASRGVSDSLMRRFGLGVSIDGSEMIRYLTAKGYTKAEMKEVGLIEQRADEYYDVFYGRLIIPIINQFGEVVAFGGRQLKAGSHMPIKYRNSSATPIFDKSKTLFGINLLKRKKQKEPVNYVIVVEGYMDVIALHGAGFDTAVAGMGTALTIWQARMLKNFSPNVYICYDGDSAGQAATLKGLDILRSVGLNVKVVSLPDDLDPDDMIRLRGAEAYRKALESALPLPAFKLTDLKRRYDLGSPDGKAAYGIEAVKVIKALDNPVEQDEYMKIVHEATGYPLDVLRRQADLIPPEEPIAEPAPPTTEPKQAKVSQAELFVTASLAHGMSYVRADDDVYPYLESEVDRSICAHAAEKLRAGEKPSVSALYTEYDAAAVDPIAEYSFLAGDDRTKFEQCLVALKLGALGREKAELSKRYDETRDENIIKDIIEIETKIQKIRNGGNT